MDATAAMVGAMVAMVGAMDVTAGATVVVDTLAGTGAMAAPFTPAA